MEDEKILRTMEERTVRLNINDLVETKCPVLNISELEETGAWKLPDADDYLVVDCGPKWQMRNCPVCGKSGYLSRNGHTEHPRLVHDINAGLVQVDLRVTVPKYKCSNCSSVFSHEFESIMSGRQFTRRLYEQIKVDSFYDTFSDVAVKYGIADTTVADIFDEYLEELEAKRERPKVGSWLAIDEKHVNHKMRGIFVDGDTGILLDMTENNNADTVRDTIMSFDGYENISFVTTDMANGYRSVLEEIFGSDVKIIVDKWHVLHDLYQKVATCRTAITDYITKKIAAEPDPQIKAREEEVKKLLGDNKYLFKFGQKKLQEVPERLQIMAEVCAAFPEFNHLRLIKEGLERIYECRDREAAEARFEEWLRLIPPSGKNQIIAWESEYGVPAYLFEEMRSLKNTIDTRWRVEVFNYFDVDGFKTNAIAEATNSFIERILINGYSFRRLRGRALFWHTAGARKRYVLDVRQKKERVLTTSFLGGFGSSWQSEPSYRMIDEYGIHELPEKPNNHKQFSVLSCLPEEYYSENQEA